MTCIDNEAAQKLQLPVIDVIKMASASHASHPANVYPVKLSIAGLPMAINAPRAAGAELKVSRTDRVNRERYSRKLHAALQWPGGPNHIIHLSGK